MLFINRLAIGQDIDVCGKGIKNDGRGRCCFATLIDSLCGSSSKEALELLVNFVQGQDSTGNGTRAMFQEVFGDSLPEKAAKLATMLHPLTINSVLNSMRRGVGMADDEGLCSLFFPLLDGWYDGGMDYIKAKINAFIYAQLS